MKTLMFTICVDDPNARYKHSDWGQITIPSWRRYCEKHEIEFVVLDKMLPQYHHPKWMKLEAATLAKKYNISRVYYVDADIVPLKTASGINKDVFANAMLVGAVPEYHSRNWVYNSVSHYNQIFGWDNKQLWDLINRYFNTGLLSLNIYGIGKLENLFYEIGEWYQTNKVRLIQLGHDGVGVDQTPLNFLLFKYINQINMKWNCILAPEHGMHSFNYDTEDRTPYYLKYANFVHATGIPITKRYEIISSLNERGFLA